VSPGYFGAFSIDGLAMALWSIYFSDSFGATVERCVNLLGDADSTASVAGQIAGAMYGYSSIDAPMLENMKRWDSGDTLLRATLLYYLDE
jgi:ADP-ribosyl-[dinitrogen reductase] hydrolase